MNSIATHWPPPPSRLTHFAHANSPDHLMGIVANVDRLTALAEALARKLPTLAVLPEHNRTAALNLLHATTAADVLGQIIGGSPTSVVLLPYQQAGVPPPHRPWHPGHAVAARARLRSLGVEATESVDPGVARRYEAGWAKDARARLGPARIGAVQPQPPVASPPPHGFVRRI